MRREMRADETVRFEGLGRRRTVDWILCFEARFSRIESTVGKLNENDLRTCLSL